MPSYYRILLQLFFLLIFGVLVVWLFSDIVLYFLISVVISAILRPITDYIDDIEFFRIKVPRIIAVLISFILLAAVPLIFTLLFVPLLIEQINFLQGLDYVKIVERVKQPINYIDSFIINNFQTNQQSGFLIKETTESVITFVQSINITAVLNYLLGFAGTIMIYLLAVSFMTFFLLYEQGLLRRNVLAVIPNPYFEVVITTIYKIERLLSNYLLGLLMQVSIMFTIISLGLYLVGMKYALTIALFAAIINLIPYLGPLLGLLFGIVVIFSTGSANTTLNEHLFMMLKIFPVFAFAQLIDNLILQPVIFSKSVKAHPLEIFIAIFAGAALAQGLGMIAAIPVYTIIRVTYLELSAGYKQYRVFKINKN